MFTAFHKITWQLEIVHPAGQFHLFPVGYIVGLGDRHIQNILIDEETAELVHIDLGKKLAARYIQPCS